MADGFLGRWSQRKQATRDGTLLADPVPDRAPPVLPGATAGVPPGRSAALALAESASVSAVPSGKAAQATPPPTLDDVQAIKPDDSFARFVAPNVAPEVRNAAMKKLFTDPHYNLMDGLDIYIDDYSKPSPLAAATLRQMASAKFLSLFDEEAPKHLGEDAAAAPARGMAPSAPAPAMPDTPATPPELAPALAPDDLTKDTAHDHIDLRLQPDHAAGCARLEREPE
ncbi:MAG: DUF3306 domain-containing protein [Comamonadaceae bacterium]|nr:DUF3306 domain-containing protein [Comamonadaceae bacterium]